MNEDGRFDRVYVAGHTGMVGSAILRRMCTLGLPAPVTVAHAALDLRNQASVRAFMAQTRPTSIIVAAAKVGGIEANRTQPASFLYDNLSIAANVIDAAYRCGVTRLLYLGSSCIYPRLAPQPMPEDALQTGPLAPTNEGYAVAKIAGMKLCQMYRRQYGVCYHSAMPTNLYGPGDNYDPSSRTYCPHYFASSRRRVSAATRSSTCGARAWHCESSCTWTTWPTLRSSCSAWMIRPIG